MQTLSTTKNSYLHTHRHTRIQIEHEGPTYLRLFRGSGSGFRGLGGSSGLGCRGYFGYVRTINSACWGFRGERGGGGAGGAFDWGILGGILGGFLEGCRAGGGWEGGGGVGVGRGRGLKFGKCRSLGHQTTTGGCSSECPWLRV